MNPEHKSNTPSSIKDLWQTPIQIFSALNREFNFTYDVAASEHNALCDDYLDEHDDALVSAWGQVNWCNPPYSDISPWVSKAAEEQDNGNTTVMLVPSDTSVAWFKNAYASCNEIRFISGRISFINAETQNPVSGNNKGSVIFIWRGRSKSPLSVSLVDRSDFGL